MTIDQAKAKANINQPPTWDSVTNQRIETLHPLIRNIVIECINECKAAGFDVRISQALRSIDEQNDLYGKGRTSDELKKVGVPERFAKPTESQVTKAYGGQGFHNYGLAVDVVMIVNKQAVFTPDKKVVEIFKRIGFAWGGDFKSFKDQPHFEMTFGYTWQQLLAKYKAHQIDSNNYVTL
jgi:hypothetical protein